MSDAADQLTQATRNYRERVEAAGAAVAAQVAAADAAAESTDDDRPAPVSQPNEESSAP